MYEIKVLCLFALLALGIAGPVVGLVHLGIGLAFEWHPDCVVALPWGAASLLGWGWVYQQDPDWNPFS